MLEHTASTNNTTSTAVLAAASEPRITSRGSKFTRFLVPLRKMDNVDQFLVCEDVTLDKALEEFRIQWKDELKLGVEKATLVTENAKKNSQKDTFETARDLFMSGVWAEQNGIMQEAIEYYRRATKLVPDIEMRIEKHRRRAQAKLHSAEPVRSEPCNITDLCSHFSQMMCGEHSLCTMTRPQTSHWAPVLWAKVIACSWRNKNAQATHFTHLPTEIIVYIMRWLVSSDLDVHSLEQFSMVCRGFYLLARDNRIWQRICSRIWGSDCRCSDLYPTWRLMYLKRKHPLYNGVYISKVEFMRQGEATVDKFYPTWQTVTYYRYLRFFPDGLVFMHTSANDPVTVVGQLAMRHAQHEGMCRGVYHMHEDKLTCILKRVKRKDSKSIWKRRKKVKEPAEAEATFNLDLLLADHGQHNSEMLIWEDYSVTFYYPDTKTESITKINLTKQDFPPLYYACVKRYVSESLEPL